MLNITKQEVDLLVANIKSAMKRIKTNEKARLRNKAVKTNLKTTEKAFEEVLSAGDKEQAVNAYKEASKKFDMAATKGVIHKNVANRKKSKLAKKVNALG